MSARLTSLVVPAGVAAFCLSYEALGAVSSDDAFRAWRVIVAALVVGPIIAGVPMWRLFAKLRRRFPGQVLDMVVTVAVLAVAFCYSVFIFSPVVSATSCALGFARGGYIAMASADFLLLCSTILPAVLCASVLRGGVAKADAVGEFLLLREQFEVVSIVLGASLVSALVPAAAWRNSVATSCQTPPFPAEYLVAFGLFLSLMVGLVLAPAFSALQSAGTRIRDALSPLEPASASNNIRAWVEQRKHLDELLGLGPSSSASIRVTFSTIAPLATGILSILLGK